MGLLRSVGSFLGIADSDRQKNNKGRFEDAFNRDVGVGQGAEDEFLSRAKGFDGKENAAIAAQAQVDATMPRIQEGLADHRSTQVSQGRVGSGFGFEDQDRLFRGYLDRVSLDIAQRSMEAGRQDLTNQGQISRFGNTVTGRGMEGMTADMDREEAGKNARRKSFFGMLGRIGGALATSGASEAAGAAGG